MALSPTSSKGISSNAVSSVFARTGDVVAADGDYSGIVAAHLTGAVAATRYVGGVATVAPTTGTFAVGDFVIAQNGKVFICTAAGTPGTWAQAGATFNGGTITTELISYSSSPMLYLDESAGGTPFPSSLALLEIQAVSAVNLATFVAQNGEEVDVTGAGILYCSTFIVSGAFAAPTNGQVSAGEVWLWCDKTNGGGALGLKSKTANGTVVTSKYPLRAGSGALATTTFVSGTAKQISTTQDVTLVVPFTGDATNNAATLLIELSPDNVTFSTLDTLSVAAALNLTGALNVPTTLTIPAAWYLKLTATHGTVGTATYY